MNWEGGVSRHYGNGTKRIRAPLVMKGPLTRLEFRQRNSTLNNGRFLSGAALMTEQSTLP